MATGVLETLNRLRGNARPCVLTEPLWGVPFNLFAPYASVFMLQLGLSDSRVGLVTTIGLAGQVVIATLAGAIIDKMGRKRATLVFDILAWSVPCLVWASAQGFAWFIAAALLNCFRRVPDISWNLLLVEDTDPDDLVHVYAMVYGAGQLAVFFAPLAGLLIGAFGLLPTVRGLYVLAFVLMTAKFVILNRYVVETRQGKVRMEETHGRSVPGLAAEVWGVARQVFATPITVYTIGLMALVSIVTIVQGTFWSIYVTERVGIPPQHIALYPFVRSLIMLAFLFLVVPRLRGVHFGRPVLTAVLVLAASQVLLVTAPYRAYGTLVLSTVLESCGYAVLATQTERLTVVFVNPRERARIVSVAHVMVLACTTPFGWVAGLLSEVNRSAPFLLNLALLAAGLFVVWRMRRLAPVESEAFARPA